MSGSLSLSSAVHVFPCAHCGETINTSARTCMFRGYAFNPAEAAVAAATLARINQACSDASYLKIMAATIGTFFVLRFVPLLGLVGIAGFLFLEFAIPVMVIRWWVKFGRIESDDLDFRVAKRSALVVGGAPFCSGCSFSRGFSTSESEV